MAGGSGGGKVARGGGNDPNVGRSARVGIGNRVGIGAGGIDVAISGSSIVGNGAGGAVKDPNGGNVAGAAVGNRFCSRGVSTLLSEPGSNPSEGIPLPAWSSHQGDTTSAIHLQGSVVT